jgi:hypothetical protein
MGPGLRGRRGKGGARLDSELLPDTREVNCHSEQGQGLKGVLELPQAWAPKRYTNILSPITCKCHLMGYKVFANVIKDLDMGYPGSWR